MVDNRQNGTNYLLDRRTVSGHYTDMKNAARTNKTTIPGGIQITAADLATPAPAKGEGFLSFLDGVGVAPLAKAARKVAPKAAKPASWWSDAGQGQECY